jgi:lactate dehydrogenase-like 2-hydroxyacid dehydrogenase
MPEKVLVYSRFPKSLMRRIGEHFDLLDAGGRPPHEVIATDELDQVRAMITQGSSLLNGEMMDRLPKLGAIVCYGTGYDGIDLTAAANRGIAVGHSPGANASSVADVAVTLMLAAVRRLVVADGYVRSGDWAAAKPSPMMRPQQGMRGRKVGVYGMGVIGRKIADRTAAFETEVGYFSRSHQELLYKYFPSLEALAEWCSVLVIAVRAGPQTHHVVNADILKRLGEDGYVVNIARGSVIAGAGLDVYGREPHRPDELTAFPNVVLTPHIGGHTLESHQAMQDCVMANLAAFFKGQPLPYAVKV